ncbi:hypothetical protein [Bacillus cereus group sp. TH243-3LC]|uniref:hypothetical protein n=1 Tax=Bacillus cereus group sp. TH243-3LC TaxID=3018045 RepID=UPI0022E553E9|nr:hypothetical protein [Bacillus cereus group sp. TH243-3LC]MDA1553047.1 hypothetical protein [Bacillus cereus group sp. TH243-3LC]
MNISWESIKDLNWGLIGAFGGAAFGQICSHFLTQNRDTKKEKKENFQNLYSPIAHKIVTYIDCEHYHFKKEILGMVGGTYTEPSVAFKEILVTLKKNIKYATPEIMSMYEELNRLLNVPEERISWNNYRKTRMEFCESFLTQYLKISKDLKALLPSTENLFIETLFICKFDLLCHASYCKHLQPIFLSNSKFIIKSIKNTNQLNKQIDKARNQIIKLRERNKKQNDKMVATCFEPGFACLKSIIEIVAPNITIKHELRRSVCDDEIHMLDLISQMDADGVAG